MSADDIVTLAAYTLGTVIIVVFLITASRNIRASYRSEGEQRADAALAKAEALHQESVRRLAEAQQLAVRFREHRAWIEDHPEEFRAALLAQLTSTTDRTT